MATMSSGYYPPPGAPPAGAGFGPAASNGYSGITVSPGAGSMGSFPPSTSASRGPTTRFAPGPFMYNGRVAAALLPCLLTVAAVGGTPVLACLTLGAMVVYLMDALGYREGAFSCIWATLGCADVAFAACLLSGSDAPVGLQIGMLFASTALFLMTGAWGSLQFRWLQMQYPAAAIYFERLLLTASLPLAALLQPLGLATFVPYSDVPYYLGALLAGLYYLLGRPLVSSFYNVKAGPAGLGGGPAVGPEAVVQTRGDGALMAALVALLPPLTYAAVHWVVLGLPLHVYAMLLLAGGMPLILALMPGGLWWLAPAAPAAAAAGGGGGGGRRLAGVLRTLVLGGSLMVALVGFEGRVVFHGFGQYIMLPPPWNWAAVTFALFGCAGVGLLHAAGALGPRVDVTLAGSFLLLCTAAGSLAAGVPFGWLPAPLLAACGLSLFYESRSLREYLVFVVGAFLTCLWFVRHHFWFLEIDVSGMRLRTLCKLAVAALVPALTVPGLVVARASSGVVGALLVLQALLLCVMEDHLYTAGHEDGALEPMYPGYLVVATSVLGLAAARLLTSRGLLPPGAALLLHALHGAKAAMLVLPEAGLVAPTALLLTASLAPLFLHGPSWLHNAPYHAHGAVASAAGLPAGGGGGSAAAAAARLPPPRRLRLAPWQGLLHILSVLVSVVLARFAVFDLVQFAISSRPTEGLLLGALLLTAAAALAPLATHCYGGGGGGGLLGLGGGGAGGGRLGRAVAALALLGCLLALLQPPLPLAGGARCPRLPLALCPRLWDERHVPMHSAEDVEVWGRGLSRREHWPRWLLIAAVVAGMAAGSGAAGGPASSLLAPAPRRAGVAGRLAVGCGAGLLVGAYTALELLPDQAPLQVLVTLSSVLAVLFVLLLALPGGGGPLALPGLALLWGVASGLALLLHAELPVPAARANSRLFPDSKVQVEAEIYRATKAALLAVVAAHALLMAFALKLKMSAALRRRAAAVAGRDHANGGAAGAASSSSAPASFAVSPSDLLCGIVPPSLLSSTASMLRLEGAGALALQRLAAEGLAWVPTVGNALTLAAVALGLALNAFLNGGSGEGGGAGSAEAIFMLAPVLLLLSQDPLILPGLGERQRYAPPQLAISGYLLASGVAAALSDVLAAGGAAAAAVGLPPGLFLAKELGLAALAVPHHALFLRYLWTQRPAPWGLALLLAAPACLLPAAMADVPALRLFGVVGAVAAVLQYFSMKHVRRVGMKVI